MGNLDSLFTFTNIRLKGTTAICPNALFENANKLEGLLKMEFKKLLSLDINESYFILMGISAGKLGYLKI